MIYALARPTPAPHRAPTSAADKATGAVAGWQGSGWLGRLPRQRAMMGWPPDREEAS